MIISIMPLAFESLSHGELAFGFFNIETDMLLLDRHFFFAGDFCTAIEILASQAQDKTAPVAINAYTLDPSVIGNLIGSIHGYDFTGFIGDVYKRFPFPGDQSKFHQQPEGDRNREIIENIIGKYGAANPITLIPDPQDGNVGIGGYVFDRREFQRLVLYVWVGGYPRWRDGIRPNYIMKMKRTIEGSSNIFFTGLNFEEERIPGLA